MIRSPGQVYSLGDMLMLLLAPTAPPRGSPPEAWWLVAWIDDAPVTVGTVPQHWLDGARRVS